MAGARDEDAAATETAAVDAEGDGAAAAQPALGKTTVCQLIETAAAANRLPIDFFTRLIWKESRFRQDAVSPKGAQGIAQFMPGTAGLRGLEDPFDPIKAIPASAAYLRDLADRFGNLGLAAAAYNSGEQRVEDWRGGDGGLPYETQDYVATITGMSAEEWNAPGAQAMPAPRGLPPDERPPATCLGIAAMLAKPGTGREAIASIAKAAWAPWGVQIAGHFSLNRAMASFASVQKRYAAIVGGGPPMVVREFNRSRGNAPMFELRVPAQTREEAGKLCDRLQAAGGACIVLKTVK